MFAYEGFYSPAPENHIDIVNKLIELGFKINPRTAVFTEKGDSGCDTHHWKVYSFSGLDEYLQKCTGDRKSLDYEIDGIVYKINNLELREKVGYTGHHPRWAIAFKFKAKQATTKFYFKLSR